jgi:4-hydroxybenzoyl-CoA reductase subunit beta
MLRLPRLTVVSPATLEEAVAVLASHGDKASVIAGGTDLLPNLKHRIVEKELLVSLDRLDELRGVSVASDGSLVIGAMTSLDAVSGDEVVRSRAPALAIAAGLVSGPQLRRMGTLGGNVLLDTRCRYINQTHFWRKSLGF